MQLIALTVILSFGLTACTTQNWYQGAQSAQTAHCMKEPLPEYEECIKQSEGNYESYKYDREQLIEENRPD